MLVTDLTAKWFRSRYMQGVNASTGRNGPFDDETIAAFIAASIGEFESALDIVITPQLGIVERHDYSRDKWRRWSGLRLRKRPVRTLTSWEVIYGNALVTTFPSSWFRLHKLPGQVHLFPTLGTMAGVPAIDAVGTFTAVIQNAAWAPDLFQLTYDAGLEDVSSDLANGIGMLAACDVLLQIGEVAMGPGITSLSTGIDGLSHSISGSSNAYGPRIEEYGKRLYGDGGAQRGLLARLRDKYRPPVAMLTA